MARAEAPESRIDPTASAEAAIVVPPEIVAQSLGEWFRAWLARLRAGQSGVLPVILGLVLPKGLSADSARPLPLPRVPVPPGPCPKHPAPLKVYWGHDQPRAELDRRGAGRDCGREPVGSGCHPPLPQRPRRPARQPHHL